MKKKSPILTRAPELGLGMNLRSKNKKVVSNSYSKANVIVFGFIVALFG